MLFKMILIEEVVCFGTKYFTKYSFIFYDLKALKINKHYMVVANFMWLITSEFLETVLKIYDDWHGHRWHLDDSWMCVSTKK